MRTLTMQGVAPNPNRQRRVPAPLWIEPEPVFQLTRKIQRQSANPTFAPERRRRPTRNVAGTGAGEIASVRATKRSAVVRVAGLAALLAALFGSGLVLRDSTARRQAFSWATLGHADVIFSTAH
jgi:hypothetical protein